LAKTKSSKAIMISYFQSYRHNSSVYNISMRLSSRTSDSESTYSIFRDRQIQAKMISILSNSGQVVLEK